MQLTGKEVYRNVQRIMTTLLGVKADILTNGADTINANDEIATIASMCYVFFRLQNKPMNYCNKIRSARKMSEAVGIEIKEKSKKVIGNVSKRFSRKKHHQLLI